MILFLITSIIVVGFIYSYDLIAYTCNVYVGHANKIKGHGDFSYFQTIFVRPCEREWYF